MRIANLAGRALIGSAAMYWSPAVSGVERDLIRAVVGAAANSHGRLLGCAFFDLGTLGGPQSGLNGFARILGNRNQAVGFAELGIFGSPSGIRI
jgi:hypothetical protein